MAHLYQVLFLVIVYVFLLFSFVFAEPIVTTKLGKIKGIIVKPQNADGFVCHAYLGVPYGYPPEFVYRYKPPFSAKPWTDVRDATKYATKCIQMPHKAEYTIPADESEDCLHLNIFTAESSDENSKKAVMVFIHGGGFQTGSARGFIPEDICKNWITREVVLVTIQYRLGYFGFLASGDYHAAGNWGIHDQIEALKWIQEHIVHFGGDPTKVTIFGHSSGGASVSLLNLIPAAEPLFAQSIAQSGSAFAYWVVNDKSLESYHVMAEVKITNCGNRKRQSDLKVRCFRHIPDRITQQATWENFGSLFTEKPKRPNVDYGTGGGTGILEVFAVDWAPTFDKDLLPEPLEELAKKAPKKPFMTGTANKEIVQKIRPIAKPTNENTTNFIPYRVESLDKLQLDTLISTMATALRVFKQPHKYEAALHRTATKEDAIKFNDYYRLRGDVSNKTHLFWELVDLTSTMFAHYPALKDAELKKQSGSPVWLYDYDYPIVSQYSDPNDPLIAAHHADDIYLMFDQEVAGKKMELQANDLKVKDYLITLWTNFAKYGDPTPQTGPDKTDIIWPQYKSAREPVNLHITSQPEVKSTFHEDSLKIWVEAENLFDGSGNKREEL